MRGYTDGRATCAHPVCYSVKPKKSRSTHDGQMRRLPSPGSVCSSPSSPSPASWSAPRRSARCGSRRPIQSGWGCRACASSLRLCRTASRGRSRGRRHARVALLAAAVAAVAGHSRWRSCRTASSLESPVVLAPSVITTTNTLEIRPRIWVPIDCSPEPVLA